MVLVILSLPNAAVSSRGERTRANGLLDCEVGLGWVQGVLGWARRALPQLSSCGRPRCHEKSKLDAEDRGLVLPYEHVRALDVAAAPSAR